MKKHLLLILSLLVLVLLMPTGCKKEPDPDVEKPSIELWSPANNATFTKGGKVGYNITFKDDNQLYSFKIDITALSPTSTSWVNHYAEMIDGTEKTVSDSIYIPTNIDAGYYTFSVTCNDTSYNEKNVSVTLQIN